MAESNEPGGSAGSVVETIVSPFHFLYQDALAFHTQSRLARSQGESGRNARAALLLYVSSAEALVHQAALELGNTDLRGLFIDPDRPRSVIETWRLLPAIVAETAGTVPSFAHETPPWPQFGELLAIRDSWTYPGSTAERRAYYRSERRDGQYEPLQAHEVPAGLRQTVATERLAFPRTGIPRDPYALRPQHLDTVRGILDGAIEALDRRMAGALTKGQRHRREPVRIVYPPGDDSRRSRTLNLSIHEKAVWPWWETSIGSCGFPPRLWHHYHAKTFWTIRASLGGVCDAGVDGHVLSNPWRVRWNSHAADQDHAGAAIARRERDHGLPPGTASLGKGREN